MTDETSRTSCPWTHEEDELLREAVKRFGAIDKWKSVATLVSSRDNKACRKRWLHSLDPSVKKTAWEPQEDQLLLRLYDELGPKWSKIALQIPGRTDDACSKRWREALNPGLKKGNWTPEEEADLQAARKELGSRWSEIGERFNRSSLECRNKMRTIENKLKSQQRSPPAQTLDPQQGSFESPLIPLTTFPDDMGGTNNLALNVPGFCPPYYAPETYPLELLQGESESPGLQLFPDPIPPASPISPQTAPFQFSSSSLHLALSEPLRSRPLPTENMDSMQSMPMFNHLMQTHSQPQSQATSPLLFEGFIGMEDITMSQVDFEPPTFPPPGLLLQGLNFNEPLRTLPYPITSSSQFTGFQDANIAQEISPISPSGLVLPSMEFWKSPQFSSSFSPFDQSPSFMQTGMSFSSELSDDMSSLMSTPMTMSVPASVINSPFSPNSMELASPLQSTSEKPMAYDSLLFSVQATDGTAPKLRRRASKQPGDPPRLSSILDFSTDASIRPYTCAHSSCAAPDDPTRPAVTFTNSKGLNLHAKTVHPNYEEEAKLTKEGLFRCGLDGCGKTYTALNGLQYHLQVATVHFQKALLAQLPVQLPTEPETLKKRAPANKRYHQNLQGRFMCMRPDCLKTYSQKSGVRYHLEHSGCLGGGSSTNVPAQLSEVPPMLQHRLRKKPASPYPASPYS